MMQSLFLTVFFCFLQVSLGVCPGVSMEMSCRCCPYIQFPPPPPPPPPTPPPRRRHPPSLPPPLTELTFAVSPSAVPDVRFEDLLLLMFFVHLL
uniref:leucine-rich repeat extensin-like protein 6 n=1 Tax=Epinephelus lanceolatus TaxID=310571 RepID=UPI0014478701|nr:leucine-rich repeat extensin-like protein 6 [Epinephelus lanceolatus]